MYTCLHVKYPLFLSGSNKTWKFLDRYSKYRLIPHFNQIRPAFSDFAQARDESSEFDVWQNGAWRWQVWHGNKMAEQWQHRAILLAVVVGESHRTAVWCPTDDQWPRAAAVCLMEWGGWTCSDFFSETAAEPNSSAVAKNLDTMTSSVAKTT